MSDSSPKVTVRDTCRVCGFDSLTPILSLGDLHVSDFVDSEAGVEKYPLELILCNESHGGCGLLQLRHTVPHEMMYRNYWYRSGMNQTMTDELHSIAHTAEKMAGLAKGDYVLDIGANDGTLLRGYKTEGIHRIGFEPARNLEQYNSKGTTKIIENFFNHKEWASEIGASAKAKVITAIGMFYDLEDPNAFVADIAKCLDKDGVFIIQMSYLPLMLSQNAFDNICHEHLEYYSLLSLENLLKRHSLEVFDVELNDVNGGSYRAYIRHAGHGSSIQVPAGAAERVQKIRSQEKELGLSDTGVYREFVNRVENIRSELKSLIEREVAAGKKVYVYGASTKGNTLLQFFGLDHTLIEGAAERNPDKWGKKTVGTHIPIFSEEEVRAREPHYFLVLPWHFMREFVRREEDFLKKGGKFIIPLPKLQVVGYGDEIEYLEL